MSYRIVFDEMPKQVFAMGHRGRPAGMIDVTPGMAVPRLCTVLWVSEEADQSEPARGNETPIGATSKR